MLYTVIPTIAARSNYYSFTTVAYASASVGTIIGSLTGGRYLLPLNSRVRMGSIIFITCIGWLFLLISINSSTLFGIVGALFFGIVNGISEPQYASLLKTFTPIVWSAFAIGLALSGSLASLLWLALSAIFGNMILERLLVVMAITVPVLAMLTLSLCRESINRNIRGVIDFWSECMVCERRQEGWYPGMLGMRSQRWHPDPIEQQERSLAFLNTWVIVTKFYIRMKAVLTRRRARIAAETRRDELLNAWYFQTRFYIAAKRLLARRRARLQAEEEEKRRKWEIENGICNLPASEASYCESIVSELSSKQGSVPVYSDYDIFADPPSQESIDSNAEQCNREEARRRPSLEKHVDSFEIVRYSCPRRGSPERQNRPSVESRRPSLESHVDSFEIIRNSMHSSVSDDEAAEINRDSWEQRQSRGAVLFDDGSRFGSLLSTAQRDSNSTEPDSNSRPRLSHISNVTESSMWSEAETFEPPAARRSTRSKLNKVFTKIYRPRPSRNTTNRVTRKGSDATDISSFYGLSNAPSRSSIASVPSMRMSRARTAGTTIRNSAYAKVETLRNSAYAKVETLRNSTVAKIEKMFSRNSNCVDDDSSGSEDWHNNVKPKKHRLASTLKKNLTLNKIFGYLARCEEKVCNYIDPKNQKFRYKMG